MRIRKLYHSDTLKYKIELVIGWKSYSLTGFWFKMKEPGFWFKMKGK